MIVATVYHSNVGHLKLVSDTILSGAKNSVKNAGLLSAWVAIVSMGRLLQATGFFRLAYLRWFRFICASHLSMGAKKYHHATI
jgi:hypothetical protein